MKNVDRLFIGIDSGTQSTKGLLLSEKTGKVLAEASHAYGLEVNTRGGREQHPHLWLEACKSVIIQIIKKADVSADQVVALGVSGQQHGFVPLDVNGNVIRPAKLWCDTETVEQCRTITEKLGGNSQVIKTIGNAVAAGFTASKVLWLKEKEPDNYKRLAHILLPHDYINYWLTGNIATEHGDASGTAYYDVVNQKWSEKVLRAIDHEKDLKACLPRLAEADEPCGRLLPIRAAEIGLSPEVLVSSGGGDNMMGAIGTGNVIPGVVTVSLGTSGTIYAYSKKPVLDSAGELAAFCSSSGGWLPLACTMNTTVSTECVRALLEVDIARFEQLTDQTPPGSNGILLVPYFNGERTPALPHATATFTGLTASNMTPGNYARSAMEGATFALRYGLEVLRRNGVDPKEIRLIGGGAKSKVWRQIVSDIFNCGVVCPTGGEAAAMGAAIQSMWCFHNTTGTVKIQIKSLTDGHIALNKQSRCDPDATSVALYEQLYERYLHISTKLIDIYPDQTNQITTC